MPELRRLRLSRSSIIDSQLAVLSALPNLRELILSDTAISDAGLEHLKPLHKLSFLA